MAGARAAVIPVAAPPRTISVSLAASPSSSHPLRPVASSVNLVMERVAKRPRGFAFLSYASEEESKNAMEGMQGKFLDGRVIFVEVARQRSEL
uniref:OSJNBa0088A01.19 protein n=2 Tax=Oryza TaxID=4527 RepID=Q7F9W0_ORYSJ|nr:OSJNBa0088A01.19 [Oryza sativa Japonica Group]